MALHCFIAEHWIIQYGKLKSVIKCTVWSQFARPSQTDGRLDKHHGNSATIRSMNKSRAKTLIDRTKRMFTFVTMISINSLLRNISKLLTLALASKFQARGLSQTQGQDQGLTITSLPVWVWHWEMVSLKLKLDKRLCYCRGTARRATSVEILWPFFDWAIDKKLC